MGGLFTVLGAVALAFAIFQAIVGAWAKRADALAHDRSPAAANAPVPVPPAVAHPGAGRFRHLAFLALTAWSPFYTFLVAVSMFAFAYTDSVHVSTISSSGPLDVVLAPTPSPTPSPAPSPSAVDIAAPVSAAPTPAPVPCTGTLRAVNSVTPGGSDIIDFSLVCKHPVPAPAVVANLALDRDHSAPLPISTALTTDGGTSYAWRWVATVPPFAPNSPELAAGGIETVVYAQLTPASSHAPVGGAVVPVEIRIRPSLTTLTGLVQGFGGFLAAVIALIAGISNFIKRGDLPKA